MSYFVGVDTGGTFTDVVILDAAGNLVFDKAFSTPHRPALGVLAALDNAVRPLTGDLRPVLEQTERFAHGTTVATNALIQRKGARVGLLMTKGFEDTLLLGEKGTGHLLEASTIGLAKACPRLAARGRAAGAEGLPLSPGNRVPAHLRRPTAAVPAGPRSAGGSLAFPARRGASRGRASRASMVAPNQPLAQEKVSGTFPRADSTVGS